MTLLHKINASLQINRINSTLVNSKRPDDNRSYYNHDIVEYDLNKTDAFDGSLLIVSQDLAGYLESIDDADNYSWTNCSSLYNLSSLNGSGCWSNRSHVTVQFVHFYNYWALVLLLFPILTIFGNILVILSVYRERTLQTATNYFIVSLAFADLLVAGAVMPFAVYVLVNGAWALPNFVCDFYIAMDVTCSTSSIFNLVAISIDRYIAVTQPIKYAKHKNNRRIWMTIALVWMISMTIGSPIVLGLNNTPDRVDEACLFYNSDFILYSSLSSFYIPCIIMVFLYYSIFKVLSKRARKAKAIRTKNESSRQAGSLLGNIVTNNKKLAETTLGPSLTAPPLVDEPATNTGSGSGDEDEEPPDACPILSNDKSTEFILATVVEEAAMMSTLATPMHLGDPFNDSGYVPSNAEISNVVLESPDRFDLQAKKQFKPLTTITHQLSIKDQPVTGSKKEKKATTATRFTIYKVNKASKKKREKSSARKERKATQTLAIVLGVFLVCWVPFFTCNVMDATCTKLDLDCSPSVSVFLFTTWLGYMNSFVNPVIYTIYNPEFRKAFKKLMHIGM